MSEGLSLDEFLGHKTSASYGGNFLHKWSKRKPPRVDTWMVMSAKLLVLWRHPMPRLVEREKDGQRRVEVWSGHFNCWESNATLQKRFKRDSDGNRQIPPAYCPFCKLIEWVYQEIRNGRLHWCEPLFSFKGDENETVIPAGGLTGLFQNQKLSQENLDEMKQYGWRQSEAWKLTSMPKCNYVFSVVDNDAVESGVQIAIEGSGLGDAVKTAIRARMESRGESEGNPCKTPYCIRWNYNEREPVFSKRYNAIPMDKIALTDEVQALITGPAPDLSKVVERGNIDSLRAVLEKHALIPMPFDDFFADAEKVRATGNRAQTKQAQSPAPVQATARAAAAPAPAPTPAPLAGRRVASPKPVKVEPAPAPVEESIPCDACGEPMHPKATKCANCGEEYVIEEEPPKPAPIARSAPKATSKASRASEPVSGFESDDGSESDDLPFLVVLSR